MPPLGTEATTSRLPEITEDNTHIDYCVQDTVLNGLLMLIYLIITKNAWRWEL